LLESKGWLMHTENQEHSRAYIYTATCGRSQAIGNALRIFADSWFDGNMVLFIKNLIAEQIFSEKDITQIDAMIAKRLGRASQGIGTVYLNALDNDYVT